MYGFFAAADKLAAALFFVLVSEISEKKWKELNSLANLGRVRAVRQFYLGAGFDPLILKGWSVARFYDQKVSRTYTDIDLVFDPKEKDLALDAWESFPEKGVAADFHFGLRHLDNLPWEAVFERSYLVELDGISIRVLSDEDNLRVTATHWLTDGGVNKEKLWDIYYLVKNRKQDFDWQRCLQASGPIRKTWVTAAIASARDYLDLESSTLPDEICEFKLPRWYKRTVESQWRKGPYIRRPIAHVIGKPKLLFEQLNRRFPPNLIAATIDAETPINESWRVPSQIRSIMKKAGPFANSVKQRIT